MSLNKRRHLTLLAPVVVDDQGVDFSVSSDSQQIVVLGGGVALEFDEELMCYTGRVEVDLVYSAKRRPLRRFLDN